MENVGTLKFLNNPALRQCYMHVHPAYSHLQISASVALMQLILLSNVMTLAGSCVVGACAS